MIHCCASSMNLNINIKIVLQYLTLSYTQTTFNERGQKAFKKGFYKKSQSIAKAVNW